MKIYSADSAARRLGLSVEVLQILEKEGKIRAKQRVGGVTYYTQCDLDNLIQDLHSSLQRASWREMETRMESVEARIESLEQALRARDGAEASHLL